MSASSPTAAATDRHENNVEQHEAYQYWGYLFKDDKTGTDKLKSLLRGLKDVVNKQYEPSGNPDLTPTQLASFYRELNGDYNQLFLGTPSAALAFIYKSLGCIHSLQPLPNSTAFTDPTVPALKTEGWIMWQTIQLLLAPEEHSTFLMDAVKRWDVVDPVTGGVFPKILPRQCFPLEPDRHMVAWYEGVSERLRREAEDEQRQRDLEAQAAEVKRIHARRREDEDDVASVDSRTPAIAYFRNPLYRHVDGPYAGRPSIVRRGSKRPQISPRQTMSEKGKEAATTVGHVIRNMASPHLWDGGESRRSGSSRERERRRRSGQRHEELPPNFDVASPRPNSTHSHHRRRSSPFRTPQSSAADDELDQSETSPPEGPAPDQRSWRVRASQQDPPGGDAPAVDPSLRHTKSHEAESPADYFEGYDNQAPQRRRNSAYEGATPPATLTPNGIGPSFNPSVSPLFATHVANKPQQKPFASVSRVPGSVQSQSQGRLPPRMPPHPSEHAPYDPGVRKSSSLRRAQGRFDGPNSPRPGDRYESPRPPSHYEDRRRPPDHLRPSERRNESPGHSSTGRRNSASGRHNPSKAGPPYPNAAASAHRNSSARRPKGAGSDYDGARPPPDRRRSPVGRRSPSEVSGRYSGVGEPENEYDDEAEERSSARRPKVTRFASSVTGVDGRKYPSEGAWR